MVTDPISDLLIRLQNASRVGHVAVSLPYSQMKHSIAQILAKEGYVGDVSKKAYALNITQPSSSALRRPVRQRHNSTAN